MGCKCHRRKQQDEEMGLGRGVFWQRVLDFYFPRQCVVCKRELIEQEDGACLHCFQDLPKVPNWSRPQELDTIRFNSYPKVKNFYAYLRFEKGNIAQQVMHAIKYNDHTVLAKKIFSQFAFDIKKEGVMPYDYVVPVPLFWKKYWTRGYNQASFLAEGALEAGLAKEKLSLLVKHKSLRNQKSKTKTYRMSYVLSSFRLKKRIHHHLKNKRLLLVDDIYTTGSTLESCIVELSTLEVSCVDILVLGKTI